MVLGTFGSGTVLIKLVVGGFFFYLFFIFLLMFMGHCWIAPVAGIEGLLMPEVSRTFCVVGLPSPAVCAYIN